MKKRALSLLLALALCLGLVPMSALAAEGEFEVDGQGMIVRYTGPGGNVTIPDTVSGVSVTGINTWAFRSNPALTSVTIPESVTKIESGAFNGCTGLVSAALPDTMVDLGTDVFYGCTSLVRVNIPAGLSSIPYRSFAGCTALSSVVVPDGVTAIGREAFDGCTNLSSVTLGAGVASIDTAAFSGCGRLSRITLPEGLMTIGGSAFRNSGLTGITFPASVATLGDYAFAGSALTSVSIPDTVGSVGSNLFNGCARLTSAVLPGNLAAVPAGMFQGCAALRSIEVPESVVAIESNAFSGCTALMEVTLHQGLVSIANGAFENCTALKELALPSTLTSLGTPGAVVGGTFMGSGLEHIHIPDGVTFIPNRAFMHCYGLKYMVIPASVTTIYQEATHWCESLTDVYYAGTAEEWQAVTIEDGCGNPGYRPNGNDAVKNAAVHYGSTGPAAEPDPVPTAPVFTDVPADAYFAAPVAWAVAKNITKGTDAVSFSPTRTCSQDTILTFLWRAAGSPASTVELTFTPQVDWAADALRWAREKGVTDSSYGPAQEYLPCTRAEAVRFIWRAMGSPQTDYDGRFTDVPIDSPYAQAVAWAVEHEITVGTSPSTFSPDRICDRGTIVTFLYRAYET